MTTDRERETAEIKALLQAQIESLCRELLPDGRRGGAYWIGARNPSRDDRSPGSFFVWIAGGAPGAWKDEATGQKGDVFQLIALVERCDFNAARQWAKAWLGLDGMAPPERKKRVAAAEQRQRDDDKARAERAQKAANRAFAMYLDARKRPFLGSPADLYLQGRGIHVEALGRMPGCLGWLPEGYHSETGTYWPIMVAGFTGENGKIVAVHRTFLAGPDHRIAMEIGAPPPLRPRGPYGKAPVSPARKIWPAFGGAAIHLWRGESGLRPRDAARAGLLETLVLVEGVEDGLSVALAMPQHRIWCAGSLGNLAQIKVPPCCDRVLLCADNDWGKPQAEALLQRAIAALVAQGVEVRVARSHIGKDVNDCLMGGQPATGSRQQGVAG